MRSLSRQVRLCVFQPHSFCHIEIKYSINVAQNTSFGFFKDCFKILNKVTSVLLKVLTLCTCQEVVERIWEQNIVSCAYLVKPIFPFNRAKHLEIILQYCILQSKYTTVLHVLQHHAFASSIYVYPNIITTIFS